MVVAHLSHYQKKSSLENSVDYRAEFFHWLQKEEKSVNTIRNYLCDLDAFSRWFEKDCGEPLSPHLITSKALREYKWYLNSLDFKPQSINRKLSTLRTFLTWAQGVGHIHSLPCLPKPIKETRPQVRWLDQREQHALLRRVEQGRSKRDFAVVRLLLNTGLRVSELCALIWTDVIITSKKGTLTVQSRKGSKRREIPLNKDARSALLSLGYHDNVGKSSPILTGQRGALSPRGVEMILQKYRGDLAEISPQSLRHTFCKNLVDARVGLKKVAAIAGHESLDTTKRYCKSSYHDLSATVKLTGEED